MTNQEFKSIRLSIAVSQVKLSAALSCTVRSLCYWEKGERKILGCVAAIMRLLVAGRIQLDEIKELCE